MLSFKKYTEQLDAIFESAEPADFKFDETPLAVARGKSTLRTHQQTVAGKNVDIRIRSDVAPYSTHRQHRLDFTVDGQKDRGDVSHSDSGMKVLAHVGHALSSFHAQNLAKRPGRHTYRAESDDVNPKVRAKKSAVYGQFMRRFAKKIGGQYEHDKETDSHLVHHGVE